MKKCGRNDVTHASTQHGLSRGSRLPQKRAAGEGGVPKLRSSFPKGRPKLEVSSSGSGVGMDRLSGGQTSGATERHRHGRAVRRAVGRRGASLVAQRVALEAASGVVQWAVPKVVLLVAPEAEWSVVQEVVQLVALKVAPLAAPMVGH